MKYKNPLPTVDIIIEVDEADKNRLILIKRKNPPRGWALPGGFVDYGESLEEAAVREAKEETSLDISLMHQLHTYSDPDRDPRHHTITTVYVASAKGTAKAMDDAENIGIFDETDLPENLVFDHGKILKDYFEWKRQKKN